MRSLADGPAGSIHAVADVCMSSPMLLATILASGHLEPARVQIHGYMGRTVLP